MEAKKELSKTWAPADHENSLYQLWEASGAFAPTGNGKPFTIIMPPTNANGALHVGHALNMTIQDILIRYHRMKGDRTLHLPGTDHAGFETQVVYEKKLEKEGKSRFNLSREELYQQIVKFTDQQQTTMQGQRKRLGLSADWNRKCYTLDPQIVEQVLSTYQQLKQDGLIYRGKKLVNWCVKHQTALSDLEVKHEERSDPLYHIRYGELIVATTRPETLFGDVAVAVHPDDKRYKKLIGTTLPLPLTDRKIPIIADATVDQHFGTGAVKVTPNHDVNDFEIATRHKLSGITVIGFDGRLTDAVPEPFRGLKIKEAREAVVTALTEAKSIASIDATYQHSVATCYKCPTVIEPLLRDSWYLAMDKAPKSGGLSLKARGLKALDEVKILPTRYIGVYRHWLENIKDWPLSRQIVWGIPIPDSPEETFDTWFSSGQWPVVTLKSTGDFNEFYPTEVMVTAYEILFFWVARMLMLGHYLTGKYPFQTVYLHGLVRDKDRQKMSKSRGNVLDPLGVIEDYGTDALRMSLVFGVGVGTDIAISPEKIVGQRNFANKIWNVARFILSNRAAASSLAASATPGESEPTPGVVSVPAAKTPADEEILKKLEETTQTVTKEIEACDFHLAAEAMYHFIWNDFADVYLEKSKSQQGVKKSTGSQKVNKIGEIDENTQQILLRVLTNSLKLLHPFMPFVTESIWQELVARKLVTEPLLISASWPN